MISNNFGDIYIHNPKAHVQEDKKTKSALIAEGGALRTIHSVGILDALIEANFYPFDNYYGVSAGACNLAAYLGKKKGRNYRVFMEYCLQDNFKSVSRFLKGGDLVDVNWLWETTEKELPIGKEEIAAYAERFKVVTTCAKTGEAHYITPTITDDVDELFQALKCSGNMPYAVKDKVMLNNKEWFDGGVADSIPVQKAYADGARRIMVIRSKPFDYLKSPQLFTKLFPKFTKQYPAIVDVLNKRHDEYNHTLDFIRSPPADCEIIEICPPKSIKVGQFTTDFARLNDGYARGLFMGKKVLEKYQEW